MKCSLGLYEKAFPSKTEIEDMLTFSKRQGFDFLELSIDKSEEKIKRLYDESFLKKAKKGIKESGQSVEQICVSALSTYTLGNKDIEIRKKGIEILKRSINLAKKLNSKIIQIPACDVPKKSIRDKDSNEDFINNLADAIELAQKEGIIIGIENMEDEYANTIEKCTKITKQINSTYLKIYPDAGNLTNAFKGDLEKIKNDFEKGRGNLIAFHLKEVREEKYGGLFYGDGIVDFQELIKHAYLNGSRRFVMEYWYTGNKKWEKDIAKAYILLNRWIKKVE